MNSSNAFNANTMYALCIAAMFSSAVVSLPAIAVADESARRSDFAPSLSPDDRRIVYYSYRTTSGNLPDLFIFNRDTQTELQLSKTPDVWEIEPQWSGDGQLIYYSGGPSMSELSLEALTPNGSGRRTIHLNGVEGPVNISPDGRFAAARTPFDEDGQSELIIVTLETGEARVVVTGLVGKSTGPNWSPDGQALVFKHLRTGQTESPEIYRIPVHGGQAQQLTFNNIEEFKLTWSSDGQTIYFMGNVGQGPSHIYRVSANAGASVRMTHDDNAPAYFPALSHDNTTIFFSGTAQSGETRIMMLPAKAAEEKATLLDETSMK